MDFKLWLLPNTIFATIHGSPQAYGMATATSDLDIKGVVIPPKTVRENLFQKFEQAENSPLVEQAWKHQRNPRNPKLESVIYSLQKFFLLASAVNPNIIEVLWTDPQHHLKSHPIWESIRTNRKLFLSTKARHTFMGYAWSQIAKIERHRKWLQYEKEPTQPTREQFGLQSAEVSREYAEAERFIKRQIEQWNLSQLGLDEMDRDRFKKACWDLVCQLNLAASVSWDNWPDAYFQAALIKMQNQIQLPKDILALIQAEKRYQDALREWQGYQKWKVERNAARKELEKKHGFDSKHAAHLIRLLRMGLEIVNTGEVIVMRPDAQELLGIRNGACTCQRQLFFVVSDN